jgi:hypothetical protein
MNRSLGLWTGGVVSSRWTKGGADTRHGGVSPERGTPGAAGFWSSSVEAEEGECDEVAPMRGSLGHDRQQRGSTTAAEDGSGELLNAQVLESGRELESEGRGVVKAGGGAHPFIRARGCRGGGCRGVTVDV